MDKTDYILQRRADMMRTKNYRLLARKLKKQLTAWRRKEKSTRHKLRLTLRKVKQIALEHERKLAAKARSMKQKALAGKVAGYRRMALDIERQLIRKISMKEKALKAAILRVEKSYMNRLTHVIHEKAKKLTQKGKDKVKHTITKVTKVKHRKKKRSKK